MLGCLHPGTFFFTSTEIGVIIIMPNKLNKQDMGIFYLYGDSIPFFDKPLFMNLAKMQIPLKRLCVDFIPLPV